ncbi:unnamed protein product [Urochloa humidicola]
MDLRRAAAPGLGSAGRQERQAVALDVAREVRLRPGFRRAALQAGMDLRRAAALGLGSAGRRERQAAALDVAREPFCAAHPFSPPFPLPVPFPCPASLLPLSLPQSRPRHR